MEDSLLVTVILPVYNVASYLEEALDSVINQTYKNLEIIIIDDGSTDGSGDICEEYAKKDGRIRLIHQPNKGLSASRNVALRIMTGEALVFLDSDDAYTEGFVKSMTETMLREKADLVICKYSVHDNIGRMKQKEMDKFYPSINYGFYNRNEALRALSEGEINHSIWNKLYDVKLWENIFFPEGKVYEDIATTFHIISRCKTVFVIEESLYLHRNRNDSISSTLSKSNIVDYIEAYSHFEHYIRINIPNVFSEQQLQKCIYSHLKRMMGYSISILLHRDVYQKDLYYVLRKNLLEIGSNIDIKDCGFRTRICRWMICYCPWLTKVAYQIYSKIMV